MQKTLIVRTVRTIRIFGRFYFILVLQKFIAIFKVKIWIFWLVQFF
jgi:hypothetical protein